jgi:hypothetical protein
MTGSKQKSEAEVTHLVHEVFHSEDFDRSHFVGFNAHTEMKHFDASENIPRTELDSVPSPGQDTWKESTISISVLQTHINFPIFLPIFSDFLERLSHLAPIY